MPTSSAIGMPIALAPALLTPQPVVSFSDSFKNPVRQGGSNVLVVISLCVDGHPSSLYGPLPSGLCSCREVGTCLVGRTLPELKQAANMSGLIGNISAPFASGFATFTDLQVTAARADLRLLVREMLAGFTTQTNATSAPFQVSPGSLFALKILADPATVSGCARCPVGTHIANMPAIATVRMHDKYDNVIYTCANGSPRCIGAPESNIIAQLIADNTDVSQASLMGTASVNAVSGVATLNDLKFRRQGRAYSILFSAPGGITAKSAMFNVVNGAPMGIKMFSSQLWAADTENFPSPPVVIVTDALGNTASSDCYSSCGGASNQCSLDTSSASCSLTVTAALVGGGTAALLGTKTTQTVNGVATFGSLRLDSNPGGTSCVAATFTVLFTLSLNGAATSMALNLERRPAQFVLLTAPPPKSVANEVFTQPVQLRLLDCGGAVVVNASAVVAASILDNPTGAQLFGVTDVALKLGVAQFLDLVIKLASADKFYTLQFMHKGFAPVPPLNSPDFQVVKPVSKILVLSGPENTTTVAGQIFRLQPQVSLLDDTDSVVSLSTAPVTASLFNDPGTNQAHNPGRSKLLGTTVVKAVAGIARFYDLAIDKASLFQDLPSTGYQIRFNFGETFSVTRNFFIEPDAWSGLFVPIARQPTKSTAGVPFTTQPWVFLVDRYVNRVNPAVIPGGARVSPLILGGPAGSVISRSYTCAASNTCLDTSNAANGQSVVRFTDLQVASVSSTFVLNFSSYSFRVQTGVFEVVNNGPHEITVSALSFQNRADLALWPQPTVSVRDVYGNVVNTGLDFTPDVTARLIPKAGQGPTQPPAAPAEGQKANTVARVWPTTFEGSRRNATVGGVVVFTDLSVRQVMRGYVIEFACDLGSTVLKVNSTAFDVTPGDAVGISSLTYPGGCSSLSPCLLPGEMRCVDMYGNVQDSCKMCREPNCLDTFAITATAAQICPAGKMCVRLASPVPTGAKLYSTKLGSADCSVNPCGSPLREGTLPVPAFFTDLTMTVPSTKYRLEFYVMVIDPILIETIYTWTHTSPPFDVLPPAPRISAAVFSLTMSQLTISFDRKTSMNVGVSAPDDTSCFPELEPLFVAKLGLSPYCTWTSPYALLINLGLSAAADSSTRIMLSPQSRIIHQAVYDGVLMTSLPATTQLGVIVGGSPISVITVTPPPVLPTPQPIVIAPSNLGACDRVSADGSLSLGDASREFDMVRWGVDVQRSAAASGILKSGSVARLIKRRIHFTSYLPGEVNTVTITLRPSASIVPFAMITISGLPEYNLKTFECPAASAAEAPLLPCFCGTPSITSPPSTPGPFTCTEPSYQRPCRFTSITGPGAKSFVSQPGTSNPVIQFVQGQSKALLVVGEKAFIPSDRDTVIQFDMTNPWLPMAAPSPVTIESTCLGSPSGGGSCYICDERNCPKPRR